MALTFLVERAHPSYAGQLGLAKQAHFIRGGAGRSGNNIDYLASTLAHLHQLGIRERELERLQGLVGSYAARGHDNGHARDSAAAMVKEFDDIRRGHGGSRPKMRGGSAIARC